MDGVLVSRYDVYRDIYRPEQLAKLGWKRGTNTDAWPEGGELPAGGYRVGSSAAK